MARSGFLQGGNHPDDIAGMIRLFRWFHEIPFMADAIVTWTDADVVIQQMRELAERSRDAVAARRASTPRRCRRCAPRRSTSTTG